MLHQEKRPSYVGCEEPVHLVRGVCRKRSGFADPGVQHNGVEPAHSEVLHLLCERYGTFRMGKVSAEKVSLTAIFTDGGDHGFSFLL